MVRAPLVKGRLYRMEGELYRLEKLGRLDYELILFFRSAADGSTPIKAVTYEDLKVLEDEGGFDGPLRIRRDERGILVDPGSGNGEQGSNR